MHLRAEGDPGASDLAPDLQQGKQETAPKSSEELVEVHCRGRQHCVDRVACNALQPVALQTVFQLQMSDARFDCGAAFHPSPQRPWRSASSSFVHMHGCLAFVIVAAIAHVHVRFADLVGGQALDLLHLRSQRVAVVGVSREALRADQPSAAAGDRHTDLVAEFVLLAGFALGLRR